MSSYCTIISCQTIKTKRIRKDPSLLARARSGQIDTLARLYACAPCDNFWWRRTPSRKEVILYYLIYLNIKNKK